MKENSENRTVQSKNRELLKEEITIVIDMNRESLLAISKALALVSSLGVLPFEVCVFCSEVAASISLQIGLDDKFRQMNPDEFWANFFPEPKNRHFDQHKQQILKTFKKHRADWRKLWTGN